MPKAKKLPSGNWRVQVYAGTDSTGKRIMKSFTAPTKKQAEYDASLWQIERKEKMSGKLTLRQAGEQYIANNNHIFSPNTIAGYTSILNGHFLALHNIPLDKLTTAQVQAEINNLSATVKPKTVRNVYTFFSAACKPYTTAFANIILPAKQKTELNIPTDEHIQTLLCAAQTYSENLYLAIAIAAYAGLRSGEILALTWDKIDMDKKTITVNCAVARDAQNNVIIKNPKSFEGTRTVPIFGELLDILQTAKQSAADDYLVHYSTASLGNAFSYLCAKCDLPHYRFHDLRHYFASTLLSLNVPDKYAMELMGHSTSDMLKKYQHLQDNARKNIYISIDNHFKKQ